MDKKTSVKSWHNGKLEAISHGSIYATNDSTVRRILRYEIMFRLVGLCTLGKKLIHFQLYT